jgi:hypothetical protein
MTTAIRLAALLTLALTLASGLAFGTSVSVTINFNSHSLISGDTLWVSSAFVPTTAPSTYTELYVTGGTLTLFNSSGTALESVATPNATVDYNNNLTSSSQATTVWDTNSAPYDPRWLTNVPTSSGSAAFADGLEVSVGAAIAGNVVSYAVWTENVNSSAAAGVSGKIEAAVAQYTSMPSTLTGFAVKPTAGSVSSVDIYSQIYNFANSSANAGSPSTNVTGNGNLVAGGSGNGGTNYTGTDYNSSSFNAGYENSPFTLTPEPSTFILIGCGLALVIGWKSRRRIKRVA